MIHQRRLLNQQARQAAEQLKLLLSPTRIRAMEHASERGASNWSTCEPIKEYGFCLHKANFRDALAGWTSLCIPLSCDCGSAFTVEQAVSCLKGGFPMICHNEIRDVTANLLTEVCHDVKIEPYLQPPTGEALTSSNFNTADGARFDIAVNGFWG